MSKNTMIIAATVAAALAAQNTAANAASHRHGWHLHHSHVARASRIDGFRHHHHLAFSRHFRRARERWAGHGAAGHGEAGYGEAVHSSGIAVQTGRASFYAGDGRTAAGGFVGSATCAHRSLPFGTRVLVTNLANARQAVLTVNDRGPFVHGRLLDVSRGAAGILGMLHAGVSQIRMQVLGGAG